MKAEWTQSTVRAYSREDFLDDRVGTGIYRSGNGHLCAFINGASGIAAFLLVGEGLQPRLRVPKELSDPWFPMTRCAPDTSLTLTEDGL